MAGDIELIMADMAPAVSLLKSGKAKALAVTTAKRNPVIPDVPTVAESGIPGFDASLFSALVAPAKTPPAIVRKLQQEVAKVLGTPEVKKRLDQLGVEPGGMSPEDTAARIRQEIATYGPIAKAAGVRE
jgi:tripartite-type tricarboxylate transporter receptor subunit TctC